MRLSDSQFPPLKHKAPNYATFHLFCSCFCPFLPTLSSVLTNLLIFVAPTCSPYTWTNYWFSSSYSFLSNPLNPSVAIQHCASKLLITWQETQDSMWHSSMKLFLFPHSATASDKLTEFSYKLMLQAHISLGYSVEGILSVVKAEGMSMPGITDSRHTQESNYLIKYLWRHGQN